MVKKILIGILLAVIALACLYAISPESVRAVFGFLFGGIALALGLASHGLGNKSGKQSDATAEGRTDLAVEELQGAATAVESGVGRVSTAVDGSAVGVENAKALSDGTAKQLNSAIDILEGRATGSPDRLH